jgi:hypothetical protein
LVWIRGQRSGVRQQGKFFAGMEVVLRVCCTSKISAKGPSTPFNLIVESRHHSCCELCLGILVNRAMVASPGLENRRCCLSLVTPNSGYFYPRSFVKACSERAYRRVFEAGEELLKWWGNGSASNSSICLRKQHHVTEGAGRQVCLTGVSH